MPVASLSKPSAPASERGVTSGLREFGLVPSARHASKRTARLGTSLSGTNLERAGDYNQRVVLQVVRRNPEVTRTEIATMTGLTAPTIANITGRLFDAGLLVEVGRRQGRRGQPATRIAINPDACFAMGLNIDRDHVTLVSLDLAGQVRSRFTRQLDFPMPSDVRQVIDEGVHALSASGSIILDRVIGVGVAVPDDLGSVALPHRPAGYEEWSRIDFERLVGDLVPWSIHVDNDAAAAAIGEAQFGSGDDHASFFYLLISAGLGGGLVIDGAYYRGAAGRSGEVGFLPLNEGGALQDVVSLSALAARLEAAGFPLAGSDPTQGLPPGTEPIVDGWIDEAAAAMVPALIAINYLINPDAVMLSGRLPEAVLDRLAQSATQKLTATALAIPAVAPVRRAMLSSDAPAVGAAILPFLDYMLPSDSILMRGPSR